MRNTSFDIYLAWSDRIVRVEADMSTLAALLAAGLAVESGCQTGGCGCCILPYVEGDLVHRDSCLSAGDRARFFCPCVTRAATRMVLAL
jgi:ferredoxin